MPTVRKPIAIACADIHLTLTAPLARAGEPDWLMAQARPLKQLSKLASKWDIPIINAGDIFDRWNTMPELINWAIEYLPEMFAIPGQHDLPLHSLDLIHKSAYLTLVNAEVIQELSPKGISREDLGDLKIFGYPFGTPIGKPPVCDGIKIAVVHEYTWEEGSSYPGAPKERHIKEQWKWKGWDIVIVGDNHKGFLTKKGNTTIFNCGALQRRKSDEISYRPQVGLIYADGSVEPYYLDCSEDVIEQTVSEREVKEDMELKGFLEELTKLQESELNFREALLHALDEKKSSAEVRKILLEALR